MRILAASVLLLGVAVPAAAQQQGAFALDAMTTSGRHFGAGYYFTDLPYTALYGQRLSSFQRPIEQYFSDAEAGTLPSVAFVDPSFLTETRTDDHPHADGLEEDDVLGELHGERLALHGVAAVLHDHDRAREPPDVRQRLDQHLGPLLGLQAHHEVPMFSST